MKIGIIGNGKHTQRIKKILKKKKLNFYIYKPTKPNYFNKKNFENLKRCNVIFIISPNNTHFNYIKKLWKGRYIFCEKPPVVNKSQLQKLNKINKSKIFFNFNFRFSKLSDVLNKINKYKLGRLVYANINITHGYALTKEYQNNWRSDKSKNSLGIFEMVLIHYLDLMNYYFNIDKKVNISLQKLSKFGSSFDTCKVFLKSKNFANIDFFASYATSFYRNIILIFDNGYIEQDEKGIKVFGPAIKKNKQNMFIKPNLKEKIKIDYLKDYQMSLEKSLNYFLNNAKKNINFKNVLFKKSLESNFLMINSKL